MLECARPGGFNQTQVMNSIEKKKTMYTNDLMECADYAMHNRLLFLLPHTFHNDLMGKELIKLLESEDDILEKFDPGKLLKDKVVDNISSVQVLIFGNTSEK